jgi:putative transposase
MDQPATDAMGLYQRCISSTVVEYLQKQMRIKRRDCVYTAAVVLWLMIGQWLQPKGTLASSVERLSEGAADPLLSRRGRLRRKRVSRRTGGYSQARQRLPKLLCKKVTQELIVRLREILNPEGQSSAYLLDGSSLELEASPGLRRAYPPAENQRGRAHWPVLRIVALHELETGLAEDPQWGPMYGPAAVSEQALAEKAMEALAAGSLVVGDRNFGVFSIAWAARQRGLDVVTRMTEERARKLAGGPISAEGEMTAQWRPSRFDGRRQGGMPEGACVEGRLISVRIGRGQAQEWLHLFTTLSAAADEVVALYGQRWKIETDLRSLKRTVRLHHIAARNESTMEKQLLTAVAAYNLVRAVMALAARRHGLEPRQLSFSFVMNVVDACWHRLQTETNAKNHARAVFDMLDRAAQGTHPKRKKRRSCPRAAWNRRHAFPTRTENPNGLI